MHVWPVISLMILIVGSMVSRFRMNCLYLGVIFVVVCDDMLILMLAYGRFCSRCIFVCDDFEVSVYVYSVFRWFDMVLDPCAQDPCPPLVLGTRK